MALAFSPRSSPASSGQGIAWRPGAQLSPRGTKPMIQPRTEPGEESADCCLRMSSINPGFPPTSSTWTSGIIHPPSQVKPCAVQFGAGCWGKWGAEHRRSRGVDEAPLSTRILCCVRGPLRPSDCLCSGVLRTGGTEGSGGSVSMCVTPGGRGGGGCGRGDLVLLWGELRVLQGANL